MKKYNRLELKITKFTYTDIITGSFEINIYDDWYE